ncbi:MAG TPA: ribonucleotide-diphosphate reductase subunit beta [Candidatus Dormibacteraeota bacterium]|nr:ribonucleotide-diphosphate reductase subunit beta [Candidatus Dormibacteraeota bacterium]
MATATAFRTPQQLYIDWEQSHWSAHEIDLSRDVADWKVMDELDRGLLYFALASLMVAEERISTQFAGLVLAQDDEEEGSFLTTQLVDEVRHMQFYARFQSEVVDDPASIGRHVNRARQALDAPFRVIFDEALVGAHDRLCQDPRNRSAKVDFITVYHLLIEGTMGITTSHFLLGLLRQRGLLPGFVDGYSRIAADEGRHILYGTGFLQRAVAEDPSMAEVVRGRVNTLMPAIEETLTLPDVALDVLGVGPEALKQHGLTALDRRLKSIGVTL